MIAVLFSTVVVAPLGEDTGGHRLSFPTLYSETTIFVLEIAAGFHGKEGDDAAFVQERLFEVKKWREEEGYWMEMFSMESEEWIFRKLVVAAVNVGLDN